MQSPDVGDMGTLGQDLFLREKFLTQGVVHNIFCHDSKEGGDVVLDIVRHSNKRAVLAG